MVDELKGDFDQIMIAWEADWTSEPDGDPICLGEIDGVWFVLGQWNTTKLETFIAQNVAQSGSA